MYLIAHEDDCEIVKTGPTTDIIHQEYPDGSRTGSSIATLCNLRRCQGECPDLDAIEYGHS